MTAAELIAFEDEIAQAFNAGRIRAPVHLSSGNEEPLIAIFARIRPQDWIFCSWRSHYHCLLKGVSKEELRRAILSGRSIALCFPAYRIFSSAIAGGGMPIAVGAALSIQRRGEDARVYCFIGEMTAEMGLAHECVKYSRNHRLPIHFVVEDNGLSVVTDTREVWNQPHLSYEGVNDEFVTYYRYRSRYPHAGAGVRVEF